MIDNKTIRKVIMLNKMLPSGSPTYEDREASGAVANFETNTVQPFVKCECTIDATESGTSVLNVEQTGKNRVNLGGTEIASNYDPADSVPFEDGYIIKGKTGNSGYIRPSTTSYSITGDAITVQASLAHYGVGFVIKVEPTQTITVSLASGSKYGVNFYDSTKKYMSSLSYYTEEHTFTIPSGAYWLIVVLVPNNLNTDETFVKVQAELGTTATTYEPYNAETYTIDLGQEILGGTADVVGGVGESVYKHKTIETISAWSGSTSSLNYWASSIGDMKQVGSYIDDIYSDVLARITTLNAPFGVYRVGRSYVITVPNTYTIEEYNDNIAGHDLYYPLNTPTEYTFTGQPINSYLGVNNVWTDAGNTKVTYKYKTGEGGSTKKKYLPIFYDMYGKEKYK